MAGVGQVLVNSIRKRISMAVDATDSPAKPLAARYATQKTKGRLVTGGGTRKYYGAPIRDWSLRTFTMRALAVLRANEMSVTVGFSTNQADLIVTIQQKRCVMFGVSPTDESAVQRHISDLLAISPMVKVARSKVA